MGMGPISRCLMLQLDRLPPICQPATPRGEELQLARWETMALPRLLRVVRLLFLRIPCPVYVVTI